MATTVPARPRRAPRVRGSAPVAEAREAQYDLLTAALIGAAIGATATLLLRRGPTGERPILPVIRGAGKAGRSAWQASRKGAGWVKEQGGELAERIPVDSIEENVRETVGAARDRIDGFVREELRGIRRAVRRQRKNFGV